MVTGDDYLGAFFCCGVFSGAASMVEEGSLGSTFLMHRWIYSERKYCVNVRNLCDLFILNGGIFDIFHQIVSHFHFNQSKFGIFTSFSENGRTLSNFPGLFYLFVKLISFLAED
ncbi:unnamed protein product [Lactuca saligna]|uniref:Uncharacterized protein n=1 Tax=Lactuca saligna TaxID=75948 RepID=A0AA35YIV7_LACSI|nr:unnamed protein product [Lactuca saligna]